MRAFKFSRETIDEARARCAKDGRYSLAFFGAEDGDSSKPLYYAHIRLDRLQSVLRKLGTCADFAARRDARTVNVHISRSALSFFQRLFYPVWRTLYAKALRARGYEVAHFKIKGDPVFKISADYDEALRLLR